VQPDADLLTATAAAQLGRLPLALQRLDAVDRNDEDHPPRPVQRLAALAMRGHVLDRVGRCLEALDVTDRAIALASSIDEQTELVTLLGNAASLHAKSAQVPKALVCARRAQALAERLGQHDGLQGVAQRMNLAVMAAAAGEYRAAVSGLSATLAQMREQGLAAYLAYAEHHQAMLWMMLGQPARAMRLLSQPVQDVPNTVRVRRLSLRGRLRRLCGVTVPGDDWRRFEIDASVDPQVAENARLELARTLEPEAAARLADEVQTRAESLGLLSAAMHARLVGLDSRMRLGATGEAADRARALMLELAQRHPTDVHWPELPWVAHRALAAAGCADEADAALQAAHGWVLRALGDQVDEVFSSGFRGRNLVNRAVLLAWQRRSPPNG
jgi:tetratricopeptide (TPR) repeat protein